MSPLAELLASGHRQVFDFFATGLRDVSEPSVDRRELLYNASVLAHYAQTSTSATDGWPAPAALATVFENFVLRPPIDDNGPLFETAAAQCLLLAGFFEDQMRGRHSIRWYADLGAGFFHRASRCERSPQKAQMLSTLARRFEPWRQRHARLSRELRAQRYLLGTARSSHGPDGTATSSGSDRPRGSRN